MYRRTHSSRCSTSSEPSRGSPGRSRPRPGTQLGLLDLALRPRGDTSAISSTFHHSRRTTATTHRSNCPSSLPGCRCPDPRPPPPIQDAAARDIRARYSDTAAPSSTAMAVRSGASDRRRFRMPVFGTIGRAIRTLQIRAFGRSWPGVCRLGGTTTDSFGRVHRSEELLAIVIAGSRGGSDGWRGRRYPIVSRLSRWVPARSRAPCPARRCPACVGAAWGRRSPRRVRRARRRRT